jgi:3-hydroxy-9,10-secoandrosta-1,3,5(10)-triene-9,17-dione monooxygenase reductase component
MMRQATAAGTVAELAVTGTALRQFMRSWPTGVAIVTSSLGPVPAGCATRTANPLPVGCTVNSFVSVSLRPPLILISLSGSSHTLGAIVASGTFGVNVLTGSQHQLADQFATSPDDDRFGQVPYLWRLGVPVLVSTAATVVCAVDRTIDAADHVLVLGIPQWSDCRDGADPLIFAGGAYLSLGARSDDPLRRP